MAEQKTRLYRREWLNAPKQGLAFVEAEVSHTDAGDRSYYADGGTLVLADCSRQIALSFPVTTEGTRANSLQKVALLLEVVEQFSVALLQEVEAVERRERAEAAEEAKRDRDEAQARTLGNGDGRAATLTVSPPRGITSPPGIAPSTWVEAADGPGLVAAVDMALPGTYVVVRSPRGIEVMPRALAEGRDVLGSEAVQHYVAGEGAE